MPRKPKQEIKVRVTQTTPMSPFDERAFVLLFDRWIERWVERQITQEEKDENRKTVQTSGHDPAAQQ